MEKTLKNVATLLGIGFALGGAALAFLMTPSSQVGAKIIYIFAGIIIGVIIWLILYSFGELLETLKRIADAEEVIAHASVINAEQNVKNIGQGKTDF